jgi:YVTN family beta-propeller protein
LGLALSSDGGRLYVTCAAPSSTVCILDAASGKTVATIPAGHTAMAPVLSPDGKTLYVCNRFNDNVSFLDLATRREIRRVAVPREPVAEAITPDGKFLLVANHIHSGRADVGVVASSVSVIDTAAGKVRREIALPNGSGLLRDIRTSPDGRHACVTHVLSRFHLPTTQVDRGWINSNALSLIDLLEMKLLNTVLLDNLDNGAGNPWAAAWTLDSTKICVTHAGTHELSVIDAPALLKKLANLSPSSIPEVPNDLSFLVGLRHRVKLADKGPRAVAVAGDKAYVANYFSDSLSVIDLAAENPCPISIALTPPKELSLARQGELYFNDATLCFQGWQSCASCHSSDARVDGLNWDNLNDGIGNPKNGKSLLLCFQTPPSMWLSVREDAGMAVRAGIRHSLFTVQPEEVPAAMDEYLKALKPIPSPHLVKGRLSAAAERGKKLFADKKTECAECHVPGLFADLKSHYVGTNGKYDRPSDKFDTPSLVELWRTAPYLHDGSAATVRDVLTTCNPKNEHGKTSHLSAQQIDDLTQYLISL